MADSDIKVFEGENGVVEVGVELGGKMMVIQTGKLAKQANGAALVRFGDSVVLVAVVASPLKRDLDYFPLQVEFEERMYSAGKMPGGFLKREGRSSEHSTLSARLIDRPIRPLFDKKMKYEVQVVAFCMSSDQENPLDVCGIVGASAALAISDIPWDGPVAGVRVGRINGEFIVNPTFEQSEAGDISLVVAGTDDALNMVEGEFKELSEDDMLKALEFGHDAVKKIIAAQKALVEKVGKQKFTYEVEKPDPELVRQIEEFALPVMKDALEGKMKEEREDMMNKLSEDTHEKFDKTTDADGNETDNSRFVGEILHDLEQRLVREAIIERDYRPDGRTLDQIRPISVEVGLLPRTHGSALFTRGQTQVLSSVTLGSMKDNQRVDGISDDTDKYYIHHYNFPPFSVGEVRPIRGPSRRDIGHGALAERALAGMLPSQDDFPYTVRVVSEVLESNGSSSMASVCGSTLSLLDAGVPIKAPVAGIAMGLVLQPDGRYKILTDIQGIEDHLGDMDFKVAGTAKGVNAVQMDIKVKGITSAIMAEALERAKKARLFILDKMAEVISEPRPELSPYAPRIITTHIDEDKIGALIGPGGKTIRQITEQTNTKIDVDDDGRVLIYSYDLEGGKKALDMVEMLTRDVEVGAEYEGTVVRLVSFGAFVELSPGKDGLVHISNIANYRISSVEEVLEIGQKVRVKVREIDDMGRVNLTMKGLNPGIDKSEEELAALIKERGENGDADSGGGKSFDRGPRPPYKGGGDRGGRPPRRDGGGRPPRKSY